MFASLCFMNEINENENERTLPSSLDSSTLSSFFFSVDNKKVKNFRICELECCNSLSTVYVICVEVLTPYCKPNADEQK